MSDLGPILITGCSTGIGAATAQYLAKKGHTVYASARKIDSLADSVAAGAQALALDVTDEASMVEAVNTIVAEHGRVGALVNNAGYAQFGAVEDVPVDLIRRQLETNVVGLARMSQLVLPSMRAAGAGRIVNIGSMGGRLVFPYGGYYHATKYAVEAISDALRYEVRPHGVQVILIEPGLIATEFGNTGSHTLGEAKPDESVYRKGADRFDAMMGALYDNKLLASGPIAIAKTVEKALTRRSPHSRYVTPAVTRSMIHMRTFMPGKAWDRMLRIAMR